MPATFLVALVVVLLFGLVGQFQKCVSRAGNLWLGMNDNAYSGNLADNSGEILATIDLHSR